VQGKIYLDAQGSRRAVFIDAEGTPIPVRGRSTETNRESTYYWAENLTYSTNGTEEVETTSYLGLSGEPVPNGDREFATRRTYDQRGSEISNASLDGSGHPMNDVWGTAIWKEKHDEFGTLTEASAFDVHGLRTSLAGGWATYGARVDEFGNVVEELYFDENGQPTSTQDGWHRQHFVRNEWGSIVERRYFDSDGAPTTDAALFCYGAQEQHDAMDRLIRWTCLGAAGAPRQTGDGYVTRTLRYDSRGRQVEEATMDGADRPVAGGDAVAIRRFDYDGSDRLATVRNMGADGKPATNHDGYAKSVTSYDAASHIEWTRFYGVDGAPVAAKDGYAVVKRQRDLWWNIVEEHYYDDRGTPVAISEGAAGLRSTFDARGEEIERVLLGKTSEAVLGKDGYTRWKAEYDDLGRRVAMHYFDPLGDPVLNVSDGVAGWRAHYDSSGREVEHWHLGFQDRRIHSIHGEAGWRVKYDRWGHQIRRTYLDTKGDPVLHAWNDDERFTGAGYALVTWAFDGRGQLAKEAYFGIHEERIVRHDGWSYATYIRDDREREIKRSYFGARDEPAKNHGYHTVISRHDDSGEHEISYLDIDDKTPILSNQRFTRMVLRYDQSNNVIDETVFGVHGEPVLANDGAHHTHYTRDSHGRIARIDDWGSEDPPNKLSATEFRYNSLDDRTEERHLDENDRPVATQSDACAIRRWRFSERQELLEEFCLGARGDLALGLDNGAAHVVYRYGRPGQRISEFYYDAAGAPFTTEERFAAVKYQVDLSGRTIEVTYVDAKGNQVHTTHGHARRIAMYDELGNLRESAFFEADDRPSTPVAKIVSEYDALRRKVREVYLGPGSKPTRLNGHAQHVTLYDYDDYGNLRSLRYLDMQGRPTRGYALNVVASDTLQLCGRWVARYDEDGKLVGDGECQNVTR
jgi:hypothetical protein